MNEASLNSAASLAVNETEGTAIRPAPSSAAGNLEKMADENGGPFSLPAQYNGSIGRTTFDDRSSEDGSLTVILPRENVDRVASQSLVRVVSVPDNKEYIASVTAGPFNEPDGLRADSPSLIASAVHGAMSMPRHHGRFSATVLGTQIGSRLVPARHRPKPNSPVHLVADKEMSEILNLTGDMRLGLVYGHDSVEVRIPSSDKAVLPRHTGMIGTTGGGKSNGVAVYTSRLQQAGVCVFKFDVEGEYTKLNEPTDDANLLAALEDRGLKASGVDNTHVYHLVGRDCANPGHPSVTAFSLRFQEISPYAFAEVMDLNNAQEERLLKAYEITKRLMHQFAIFPRADHVAEDNALILSVDEFDRGWPSMTLDHLCYVVSAVISVAEGQDSEPPYDARGFKGHWNDIQSVIRGQFGGSMAIDDDGGDQPSRGKGRSGGSAPKFGNVTSWKAVSARINRLRRLGIFDRQGESLKFNKMLEPGRINIIDLSDVENLDVRNLAIAEILRGVLWFQQELYEASEAEHRAPLNTNVIIEEAHEFLSSKRIARMPTLRDQLVKIAKRGRKRYLGLTFVTQSPNDLPDEVLGLINNWIIYKMDDRTAARIRGFVPNADESLWSLVSGLGQGQALASFVNMRRPVIVAIDPASAKLRMSN